MIEDLKRELDDLFAEWEERHKFRSEEGFIRDGIFDGEKWFSSQRKILFVLKEAYNEKEHKIKNVCEYVRDVKKGPFKKTWWTVTNWAYAAQHTSENTSPDFPSKEKRREGLLSSAGVNIKKSDGRGTSDLKDIAGYAERDGDLIRREIKLLDPDIVICGNTWDVIKNNVWNHEDIKPLFERIFLIGRAHYLDLWHPANTRVGKLKNYWELVKLLRDGIAGRLPQPECQPVPAC